MKTNETPDKIYLNPLLMEDGESIVRRCTFERQRDSQIEYIRKDAFIEKAVEWIEKNFNMPNDFESHFRKAMEKNMRRNDEHLETMRMVDNFFWRDIDKIDINEIKNKKQ